jgi:hypothetical protein
MLHHPDPVTQDGAAGVWRRRVHGQDSHPSSPLSPFGDESVDQGGLPAPGRPGNADHMGATPGRKELWEERTDRWIAVLDPREQPGERTPLAGRQLLVHRGVPNDVTAYAWRRTCSRK